MTATILEKVNEVIKSVKPMSHIVVFDGANFKAKYREHAEICQEDSGIELDLYELIIKNMSSNQRLTNDFDGTVVFKICQDDLLLSIVNNAAHCLNDNLPSQKHRRKKNRYYFSTLHRDEISIEKKDLCNAILVIYNSYFCKKSNKENKMSKETLMKICEAFNHKYRK
jgi:hypothetical protein